MADRIINVDRMEDIVGIFGNLDTNVELIEEEFNVRISYRNGEIKVSGDIEDADKAAKVLEGVLLMVGRGQSYNEIDMNYVISLVRQGKEDQLSKLGQDCVCVTVKGKPIKAKTLGQEKYVKAVEANTITMAIGPAGTGKTYLAVAIAVEAFRSKQINRIIITRPAVEAGEKLGFLPGDLQNKVDPYLRPLHDALFDMLGVETYQRYLERGNIEVAPLAYMRGRTLDDAFIILDEAQNTTPEQMKMFLTRLGFNSKAVVTGDLTQTDLPTGQKSGLSVAVKILDGVEDIAVHAFTAQDVVRHKLVQRIIEAYDKYEHRTEKAKAEKNNENKGQRSKRT